MSGLVFPFILLVLPVAGNDEQPKYVMEKKPAKRVRAVLSLEFKHPKLRATEWFFFVPKALDLPGQSEVEMSLAPSGKLIADLSVLKRPMFAVHVPVRKAAQQTAAKLKVTYTATLHRRVLRLRGKDEKAPAVARLAKSVRRLFLLPRGDLDYRKPDFQQWLKTNELFKEAKEDDVDFAKRVFLTIRKQFTYDYGVNMNRNAAKVTKARKSDCGGLSIMFAAALRANKIPARVLYGRWALSAKKGDKVNGIDYYQAHVIAEFHAEGVGWIPADPASAIVHDRTKMGLTYFGRNLDAFIAMQVDPDVKFNTIRFGTREMHALQNPAYFVSGSGSLKGGSITRDWQVKTVRKIPN